MAAQVKFSLEGFLILTAIPRTYEGTDVDIVEMGIKLLEGFVTSIRRAIMPSTFLVRLPGAAGGASVDFGVTFVLFDSHWYLGAVRPVAAQGLRWGSRGWFRFQSALSQGYNGRPAVTRGRRNVQGRTTPGVEFEVFCRSKMTKPLQGKAAFELIVEEGRDTV